MPEKSQNDTMARLAICAVVATAAVYAAQKLCEGKNWPLWEKYGPWILENKTQAIAVAAAVLYAVSLAVWPDGIPFRQPPHTDADFTPCG